MVIEEFMYRVARRPLSKLIALLPAAEPPPTFEELERNVSRACLPVTLRQRKREPHPCAAPGTSGHVRIRYRGQPDGAPASVSRARSPPRGQLRRSPCQPILRVRQLQAWPRRPRLVARPAPPAGCARAGGGCHARPERVPREDGRLVAG